MPTRNDPYKTHNFLIEIDGISVADFTECSGLNSETEVIEYRTGSEETTVRKLPGLRKHTNITLKRGLTQNRELFEWRKKIVEGDIERRNMSIIILNERHEEGIRYNLLNAWPVKWEGPVLDASKNEVAVETLEIAYEALLLA